MATFTDFIAALDRDSRRFAQACLDGSGLDRAVLDRTVPSCPGWTVRDLVAHLGEVQRFWSAAVRLGGPQPTEADVRDPVPGPDLLDWFDRGRADLRAALRAAPPDGPCWTWWGADQPVAAVARRQSHEAAVHRWDIEAAAGVPAPLHPDLAGDGVDEFVDIMIPRLAGPWDGPDGSVLLRATDTDRAWVVTPGGDRTEVTSERIDPSSSTGPCVTVWASASELDLLLWRRLSPGSLRVDPDPADPLLTAFLAWTELD